MAAPVEGHVVVAGRNSPGVLRKGVPGESKALKEKVILYYESILKGEDPSRKHPRFWEEFFLLKVNVDYLIKRFDPMPAPELVQLKSTINLLFAHCVRALNTEDSTIRYVNALQTLCTLIKVIFKKTGSTNSSGFDVLDVLIGFESAECHMQNLVDSLNTILTSDSPVSLKNLALKLILIIITVSDNISQNVLMEYLMVNSLFESLMAIFSHPESRDQHGADTSLVLTILVNYRKFEAANPYVIKLSVLDDELALNGLGWIIGNALFEYNSQYHSLQEQPQGWLGTLSHMVGSMWTSSSVPTTVEALRINESILLALYEAVHLNRNFITILTHTKSPLSPRTPPGVPIAVASSVAAVQALGSPGLPSPPSQPANLLGMFLTFSSIVLQNTKVERCHAHARLSLVILTCITEDQFANSFLHDTNISFPVTLYRAPFLHRKVKTDKNKKSVPLACSLLDLMVEFTLSHLSKGLLVDLHSKCLGIIHRVLCYQKRCRVRLDYDWKELWTALINLMKFLVSNEDFLLPSSDIFALIYQVSIIFNLFITYGDTFLPSPATYDELYYEIMRTMEVFESVHTMVSSHASSSSSPGLQESASRTLPSLKNIQSIVTHYAPKMAAWKAFNPGASMDHDQVLEVIRTNYDTLTLKLQDNLDYFEKYSERPNESGFFSQLLRMVVTECRDGLSLANLQQKIVLSELASMPGPTSAKPVHKKASFELSSFGFFQRSGVKEFMTFTSDLLVDRTNIGERQSVREQEYICHVYVRSDCLASVVVTDMEYPSRVVFTLINKMLDQYSTDYPRHLWTQPGGDLSYPALDTIMKKYQDPKEADPLMKVQNEIDETKIVLHETVEAVLRRGEKLDDLVHKTDYMSSSTKALYEEDSTKSIRKVSTRVVCLLFRIVQLLPSSQDTINCLMLKHETIDAVLRRGEKLDDLVQKTDYLSGTSKSFYKETKGGSCCALM